MRTINPRVLQEARETKGFSHATLADASKINAKTIKRIESGKFPHNRDNVIKNLARALGISESELITSQYSQSKPRKLQQTNSSANADKSEMEPKNEKDDLNDIFRQSQLNVRVSDRARNALSLTAARYNVSFSQVVEIAPLLFYWAAEQSLQQRRQNVEAVAQKTRDLYSFQEGQTPHLGFLSSYRYEDLVSSEQNSIDKLDIFGTISNANIIKDDLSDDHPSFDIENNNPFASFLRKLTADLTNAEMPDNTETFENWSPDGSPNYNICQSEALGYLGGDAMAAEYVLDGYVPLHKIPNELREKNRGDERAKWICEEAAARSSEFDIEI